MTSTECRIKYLWCALKLWNWTNERNTTYFWSWDASITPYNQCKRMSFTRNGPLPLKVSGQNKTPSVLLSRSCLSHATEVLVKSRACGQSHVSLCSLWVVPWGAVWLFWDNLLITIQYGPLERERASGISFFSPVWMWINWFHEHKQASSLSYLDTKNSSTLILFIVFGF